MDGAALPSQGQLGEPRPVPGTCQDIAGLVVDKGDAAEIESQGSHGNHEQGNEAIVDIVSFLYHFHVFFFLLFFPPPFFLSSTALSPHLSFALPLASSPPPPKLWNALAFLLNALGTAGYPAAPSKAALPEDVELRGFGPVRELQSRLDFGPVGSEDNESARRVAVILALGKELSACDVGGLAFDAASRQFVVLQVGESTPQSDAMTEQWTKRAAPALEPEHALPVELVGKRKQSARPVHAWRCFIIVHTLYAPRAPPPSPRWSSSACPPDSHSVPGCRGHKRGS